jgi:hypothetical protein
MNTEVVITLREVEPADSAVGLPAPPVTPKQIAPAGQAAGASMADWRARALPSR